MYAPLISKIRCHNPNQKKSKICNKNYLVYIAIREGVDLTPTSRDQTLQKEIQAMEDPKLQTAAPNDLYIKYIAERPRSNGLFGNISQLDPTALGNHLADLTANGRNIYRGIISLHWKDALELGYDKKENWESYIRSILPDVAAQFGIPIDKLQWAAAVHMEKSHPHCHYMFWNSESNIRSPYIHKSTQRKCRELLSKEMFKAEYEQAVIDKTTARDLLIDLGKENIISDFEAFKSEPVLGTTVTAIPGRIHDDFLDTIKVQIHDIIQVLPSKGRLSYSLVPSEAKKKIDNLTETLFLHPDFKKAYSTYITSVENLAKTYSPSAKELQYSINAAKQDIYKRIGNIILSSVKTYKRELSNQSYQEYLARRTCYTLCRSVFNVLVNETHKQHIAQDFREHSTSRESRIDRAKKAGKNNSQFHEKDD